MNFSITKNGKPLDPSLYNWDEKTKTLSTDESYLILDFSGMDNCTFDTGNGCTFDTGGGCTFKTKDDCTFDTGGGCTFKTGRDCTLNIYQHYKKIEPGKRCVAIIRHNRKMKIINFDDAQSIRFLKET